MCGNCHRSSHRLRIMNTFTKRKAEASFGGHQQRISHRRICHQYTESMETPGGEWPDLPLDIERLILSKVPFHVLKRCRLVHRSWQKIIDDHLCYQGMNIFSLQQAQMTLQRTGMQPTSISLSGKLQSLFPWIAKTMPKLRRVVAENDKSQPSFRVFDHLEHLKTVSMSETQRLSVTLKTLIILGQPMFLTKETFDFIGLHALSEFTLKFRENGDKTPTVLFPSGLRVRYLCSASKERRN